MNSWDRRPQGEIRSYAVVTSARVVASSWWCTGRSRTDDSPDSSHSHTAGARRITDILGKSGERVKRVSTPEGG